MFHHFKCIIQLNYEIRPSLVQENHEDAESGSFGSIFPHLLIARIQRANLFLKASEYGFECDVDGCSGLLCVHILLLTKLLYIQPVHLGNQLLFSLKPRAVPHRFDDTQRQMQRSYPCCRNLLVSSSLPCGHSFHLGAWKTVLQPIMRSKRGSVSELFLPT